MKHEPYTCPELSPDRHRRGASDHLAYPSVIVGQRVPARQLDNHRHVITPTLIPNAQRAKTTP